MPIRNKIITANGSYILGVDWLRVPFAATLDTFPNTAATYGVQTTADDVMTTPSANVRWTFDTNAPAGTTTAKRLTYSTPITAVQIVVTAVTGQLEVKLIQGV